MRIIHISGKILAWLEDTGQTADRAYLENLTELKALDVVSPQEATAKDYKWQEGIKKKIEGN